MKGASPRVLNLDASYPRRSDPLIEQQHEEGVLRIHLREFTPGTLVEFTLRGFFPKFSWVAPWTPLSASADRAG